MAWYSGHPDYADHSFDLSATRAVVVGNGNVALDVARMLVLDPDELSVTDTADHAVEALAAADVQEVMPPTQWPGCSRTARAGTLNAPVTEATAAWLAERAPGLVTWEGWRAIDAHETALGSPQGRPRVKLVRVAHMLEIAVGA